MEDMDDVALGLREALEAEHQWLLASIEEDSIGKQLSWETKAFQSRWKGEQNLQSR